MSTDKDMSKKPKIVLFLGNADSEGVTAKLKTVGTLYKRKMLESRPENWRKIISIFQEYDVSCVVVKLTNTTFHVLCRDSYKEIRKELLELIASKPNLFLAHESLLTGEQTNVHADYIAHINDYDPELTEDYAVSYTHLTLPTIYSV